MAVDRVQGHITVVQEERFRLVTDAGQGLLFTLAHNAPVGGGGLHRLRDMRARVVVEYEGEPDLASGVARSVRTTSSPRGAGDAAPGKPADP